MRRAGLSPHELRLVCFLPLRVSTKESAAMRSPPESKSPTLNVLNVFNGLENVNARKRALVMLLHHGDRLSFRRQEHTALKIHTTL